MDDLIGKTLAGRYRVDAFLGRGGMAEVYKVWDMQRSVYLAMKVLHEDLAQDKIFLRRFQREAQTLSRLQHPNIIRFYGLEQVGRLAFILMDYVKGHSLRQEIFDASHALSNERVLEVMRSICAALSFAHSQGFVHCDIKPANVLIDDTGRIQIADFGISRMSETATSTTMVGAGTPAYMSPEQVRGLNPTPQSDIYSLGVVLFEMLTGGERPFIGDQAQVTGTTGEKIRWEQIHLQPPSPRIFNPAISPKMEAVVMKCLAKDPNGRYGESLELLRELERVLGRITDVQDQKSLQGYPESDLSDKAKPEPIFRKKTGGSVSSRKVYSAFVVGGGIVALMLGILVLGSWKSTPSVTRSTPTTFNASVTPSWTSVSSTTFTPIAAFTPSFTPSLPVAPTMIPYTPTNIQPPSQYSLAFSSDQNGAFEVYLMDPDSGASEKLNNPSGYNVALWPTFCNDRIAAELQDTSKIKTQWIYFLESSSSNDSRLNVSGNASALGVPRCSPDGSYIAYSSLNSESDWPMKINSLTLGNTQLTLSDYHIVGYASWFQNSRDMIYMVYQKQSKNYRIIKMEALDSKRTNDISPLRIQNGSPITQSEFPAISPDGSQMAFVCTVGGNYWLCVKNFANGVTEALQRITYVTTHWDKQVIISAGTPAWSSDGSWIYFSSGNGGKWDIYRVHPDGSGGQNLTGNWPANEIMPATKW